MRTIRTPTLLGNTMADLGSRLPSYRGISPYPAPPQETAQYAGDATVPSARGGTANMSMAPSAPTMSRSRTMAAPMMQQPVAPPVMSPTLRTSIAGREQQADLYAALPSTLPGGGPVSPSALRQRSALVTKMRGIDDSLTAPYMAQPVPEDPRVTVAKVTAQGKVDTAKASAKPSPTTQTTPLQQSLIDLNNARTNQIKNPTTKPEKPAPSTQTTPLQQSEIDRRAAMNERDRAAIARGEHQAVPEAYVIAVKSSKEFKDKSAEEQLDEANRIWQKHLKGSEPPKPAPTVQPSNGAGQLQTGAPQQAPQGVAPGTQANAGPRTYKHTATGPNGEKVGSNDGVNWEPIQ